MTTFNRKSWHGHLACVYGPLPQHDELEVSICKYVRAMFLGACWATILAGVGGAFSAMLGDSIAWISAMCVMGQWIHPNDVGLIWPAIFGIVLVMLIFALVHEGWKRYRRQRILARESLEEMPPSGPIAVWYRSFKEKTCFNVTVR